MPFQNPILGGTSLVRPAINSPNYVAGSAGWAINRDGTAEFNSGVFRGAVLIGNPPAQGATSLGLTGTAIPAVLRNFDADYTWYVADIYWIDGTEFFFNALVHNTPFTVTQRMTGIYTTTGGVQLQTFIPSNAANQVLHGSSTYDTARLVETWRASDLTVDNTSTISVAGSLAVPGSATVAGSLTVSGTQTLSGTLAVSTGTIAVAAGGALSVPGNELQLGAWTAYTPTWTASTTNPTVGNSTITARYQYLNQHTVCVAVHIIVGSTFAIGSGVYSFGLPVAMVDTGMGVGAWYILDSGVANKTGSVVGGSTTTVVLHVNGGSTAIGSGSQTWSVGDEIRFTMTYEV